MEGRSLSDGVASAGVRILREELPAGQGRALSDGVA